MCFRSFLQNRLRTPPDRHPSPSQRWARSGICWIRGSLYRVSANKLSRTANMSINRTGTAVGMRSIERLVWKTHLYYCQSHFCQTYTSGAAWEKEDSFKTKSPSFLWEEFQFLPNVFITFALNELHLSGLRWVCEASSSIHSVVVAATTTHLLIDWGEQAGFAIWNNKVVICQSGQGEGPEKWMAQIKAQICLHFLHTSPPPLFTLCTTTRACRWNWTAAVCETRDLHPNTRPASHNLQKRT